MYNGVMMIKLFKYTMSAAFFLSAMSNAALSAQTIELAADNCFAAGQRYAAQQASTLVAAEAASRNGQPVCKVVILTQAKNGERPKREVVYIPQ